MGWLVSIHGRMFSTAVALLEQPSYVHHHTFVAQPNISPSIPEAIRSSWPLVSSGRELLHASSPSSLPPASSAFRRSWAYGQRHKA